ncbi:MAG TPA: hypothetical protein GX734_00015 [Clostridiaceae bacterium]|jgi:hypothetical protein|nr:hypothetical protein [Clostridiaceae bacterium]
MLLFDDYDGDLSFLGQKPAEKTLFVCVNHVHPDHFNPEIFSLTDIHHRRKYLLLGYYFVNNYRKGIR